MNSLDELVDARIAASLAKVAGVSRWIARSASPLPRKTIVRLVNEGVVRAARVGKCVLLERDSHDAYIAAHPIVPKRKPAKASPAANDGAHEDENDDVLEAFGVERAS